MLIKINIYTRSFFIRAQQGSQMEILFHKMFVEWKNKFDLDPTPKGPFLGGGGLVASRCIFIQIMTLLNHRNTATT